jgi:hypothetical protein
MKKRFPCETYVCISSFAVVNAPAYALKAYVFASRDEISGRKTKWNYLF